MGKTDNNLRSLPVRQERYLARPLNNITRYQVTSISLHRADGAGTLPWENWVTYLHNDNEDGLSTLLTLFTK